MALCKASLTLLVLEGLLTSGVEDSLSMLAFDAFLNWFGREMGLFALNFR